MYKAGVRCYIHQTLDKIYIKNLKYATQWKLHRTHWDIGNITAPKCPMQNFHYFFIWTLFWSWSVLCITMGDMTTYFKHKTHSLSQFSCQTCQIWPPKYPIGKLIPVLKKSKSTLFRHPKLKLLCAFVDTKYGNKCMRRF